mgnify:CR=1 FL=1
MYKQREKIIVLFSLLLLLGGVIPGQAQKDNRFEVSKNLDIFNALVKEVEMFYVDSVDVEKTVRRGIDAMLGGLDPYTEYYPEQEMDKLKFMTTGEYGGIGSYIRERKEGGVYIIEPFEGMPAALAGLKAGDRILAIDTVDVTDKSSDEVSALLKGVPNTKMVLKIQSPYDKKPREVELVRRQILENQVTYYGVRGDSVGYIYLKGFTDKSAQEVKNAFEDLKKNHHIKSLILDLRNNGGGLLESATQIVGMFVPKGKEVVSTKGKISQWDRTYRTPGEPLDTVMPMAVLINGASASAAPKGTNSLHRGTADGSGGLAAAEAGKRVSSGSGGTLPDGSAAVPAAKGGAGKPDHLFHGQAGLSLHWHVQRGAFVLHICLRGHGCDGGFLHRTRIPPSRRRQAASAGRSQLGRRTGICGSFRHLCPLR